MKFTIAMFAALAASFALQLGANSPVALYKGLAEAQQQAFLCQPLEIGRPCLSPEAPDAAPVRQANAQR